MLQLISKTEFLCISLQYIMQLCKKHNTKSFAKGRTSQQNSMFSLYCQKKKVYCIFLLVVILTFLSFEFWLLKMFSRILLKLNSVLPDIFILLDIPCILNTFIHTFKYIFKMHFKGNWEEVPLRLITGSKILKSCKSSFHNLLHTVLIWKAHHGKQS